MPEKLQTLDFDSAISRREALDGKEFLVVPVVALQEGVFNGVYHPADEVFQALEAWNGSPVTVDHPRKDGEPITANSPEIMAKQTVGTFYNVNNDGGKLKGEAWLDVEKSERLGFKEMVGHFDAGKIMNLSVGYFSQNESHKGEWNGKPYGEVVKGIRPDHLALLLDQSGACSVEDGCGAMRTFSEKLLTVLKEMNPMAKTEKKVEVEPVKVQTEKKTEVDSDDWKAFQEWKSNQQTASQLKALEKLNPFKESDVVRLQNLLAREDAKLNILKDELCKCNKGLTRQMLDTLSEEAINSLIANSRGTDYSVLGSTPEEGVEYEEYPSILMSESFEGDEAGKGKNVN